MTQAIKYILTIKGDHNYKDSYMNIAMILILFIAVAYDINLKLLTYE